MAGIGAARIRAEIDACESAGMWWEAALLWAAQAASHWSGADLKRALAAISHVEETDATRAFELRVCTNLQYARKGGLTFGSAEHNALQTRLAELVKLQADAQQLRVAEGRQLRRADSELPSVANYDAAYSVAVPA